MSEESNTHRRRKGRRRKRKSGPVSIRTLALPLCIAGAIAAAFWWVSNQPKDIDTNVLKVAEELGEAGKVHAQISRLKQALNDNPNHGPTRWELGKAWLAARDGPAAFKELERARDLGIDSADLRADRFQALLMSREFNAVLVQTSLLEDPKEVVALAWMRAQAELGLGKIDVATRLFLNVVKSTPNNTHAQLGLARIALLRRDYTQVRTRVDTVLQLDPGSVDGWLLKGELELARADATASEFAFKRAIELLSPNPRARLGLARVHISAGRHVPALTEIELVLSANANHPFANYLKAEATWRLGDERNALGVLFQNLTRIPDHVPSLILLGWIHYLRDELEQSERALNRAITNSIDPSRVAHRTLAAVYLKRKQADRAIQVLEALANDNDDAETLALLAHAKIQSGQEAEGKRLLKLAAEAQPERPEIRTQVALGHLSMGAADKSIEEFEAALALTDEKDRLRLLLVVAKLRQRSFDEAAASAARIHQDDPDNAVALYFLALAQQALGDLESATASLEKAFQLAPEFLAVADRIVDIDLSSDQPERARARYQALVDNPTTHEAGVLRMARVETALGNPAKAKEWLIGLPIETQQKVDFAVKIAALEAHLGDLEGALTRVEQAREAQSQSSETTRLLAEIQHARGNTAEALRLAEEAQRAAPLDLLTQRTAGIIFFAAKQYKRATQAFEALLRIDSRSANNHYARGISALQNDDLESANAAFATVLQIAPDHVGGIVGSALVAQTRGDKKEAERMANQLSALPNGAVAEQLLRANQLHLAGNYAEAVTYLNPVVDLNATPAVILGLVDALDRTPVKEDAEDPALTKLNAWAEKHPDHVEVWAAIAQRHEDTGNPGGAVYAYKKILALQPLNTGALNNLAWIYMLGDQERAIDYAQQAYELDPQRMEFADTFGWALVKFGRVERGLALLERAAKRAPDNPAIAYHHSVALAKAGEHKAAREILVPLLQSGTEFPERAAARSFLANLRSR
ncbi:MAG: PEP-CTERM system TPR-repeat protein PrsT [Gammaproteobacteria bacterium]|nr:PEP-CTERM system TPR-repeat protein PrsT [Gammaproteobacteria bacterium]